MTRFAFVIHPLNISDVARKYPIAKFLPASVVEAAMRVKKPMVVSEISGVRSRTGAETQGWFIGCPLTPKQMVETMPIAHVYGKIVDCAKLAADNLSLTRRAEDRETKNLELFRLGNEILKRYEQFTLGQVMLAKEPFIGLSRTKLENLVQDYQDKIADQRAKP